MFCKMIDNIIPIEIISYSKLFVNYLLHLDNQLVCSFSNIGRVQDVKICAVVSLPTPLSIL